MISSTRPSGTLCIAMAACISLTGHAPAAVINVPPVVVTGLARTQIFNPTSSETTFHDGISIPSGPGTWSGPGFTASIGTGDVVVIRIEAPAGKQFSINTVSGALRQGFGFYFAWQTGTNDPASTLPTPTVTFENFTGAPLTDPYSLGYISDAGGTITADGTYTVNGPCTFTAIQMSFNVTQSLAHTLRTYGAVQTVATPALTGSATFAGTVSTTQTVMSLVPAPGAGACCHGATCGLALPEACIGTNAAFLGAGAACSPPVRGGTINACCPVDFNGAGGLEVQDIFAYLNAWFAGCP